MIYDWDDYQNICEQRKSLARIQIDSSAMDSFEGSSNGYGYVDAIDLLDIYIETKIAIERQKPKQNYEDLL